MSNYRNPPHDRNYLRPHVPLLNRHTQYIVSSATSQLPWKSKVLMAQGLEPLLRSVMVENGSVKVDYQVVKYQGNHGKQCLGSPEVIHI
jgi:hypothetical protein